MEDEVKFCENCKRNVAAKNFVIHTVHCERKIQLCPICGELVPRSEQEDHLKESHIHVKCSFCEMPVEKWKLESHEKDQCQKRQVLCEYCDLSHAFDTLSEHEKSCGSRTDECSICNGRFLLKDKEVHLKKCQKNNLVMTQMLCKYCESEFSPEIYPDHVMKCVFRSEKCLTCGEDVRLKDVKEHGDFYCKKNRRVSSIFCENCDQMLSYEEFQNHRSKCKVGYKTCRLCQEPVKMSDLEHHLENCQKKSRRISSIFCENCDQKLSFEEFQNHRSKCKVRYKTCHQCQEPVKMSDLEHHLEICQKRNQRMSLIICEFCDQKLSYEEFQNHRSNCKIRYKTCRKCLEAVKISDLEHHLETCPKVKKHMINSTCEHCGEKFPSDMLRDHESVCDFHFEKCSLCNVTVKFADLATHKELCEKIKKYQTNTECEYCGKMFLSALLEDHKLKCDLHFELCSLCDDAVKAREMESHKRICKETEKYKQKVTCEHCGEKIPINELADHEYSCDFYCEKCSLCDASVKAKDMDKHRRICEKKTQLKVECQHCDRKFHKKNIEDHQNICEFRLEKCDLCYDIMPVKDLNDHLKECEKINLPHLMTFCDYCKSEIPLENIDYHVVSCAATVIKCLKCKRVIKRRDFKSHETDCVEDITWNEDKDLTNKYQVDEGLEIDSNEYPLSCEYCLVKFPLNCLHDHMETCQDRTEECGFCNTDVKFKDKKKHKEICKKPNESLAKCDFCRVTFRSDCLKTHIENCSERIENCSNCQKPIMYRDKRKHMEECKKATDEETCAICSLSLPKKDLEEHFQKCLAANSQKIYTECGSPVLFPVAADSDNYKAKMQSKNSKTSAYPSMEELELCPHCCYNFPVKRFQNHKKYCKKALRVCPICDDTYHVDESDDHKNICDATDNVLKQENDFPIELQNKFEVLPSEEVMRKKETACEICPYCSKKISNKSYSSHLSACSKSVKECCFCKTEFPKVYEKEHFKVCPKFQNNHGDKDEFVYAGFSNDASQGKNSSDVNVKCHSCKKYIPAGAIESHSVYCPAIKNCSYCQNAVYGSLQTHLTKCQAFRQMQQNSHMNKNTGAKPKKKKSEEPEGVLQKVKNWFTGSEKTTCGTHIDVQTSQYHPNYNDQNYSVPTAPIEEKIYVPCEYCNEKILMNEEEIVLHETKCRPDLFSLPKPVTEEQLPQKPSLDEYYYDNQNIAYYQEEGIKHFQNHEDENLRSEDIPPIAEQNRINNYTFMRHFNDKYDLKKDASYRKDLGEASEVSLKSERNDVKCHSEHGVIEGNTLNYERDSKSKYGEKKSKSKQFNVSSDIECPESDFKSQKNEENLDVKQMSSHQRKVSTEPGEFLKNNLNAKEVK